MEGGKDEGSSFRMVSYCSFWGFSGFDGMRKKCCLHIFKVKNFILAQKDLFSLNGPIRSIVPLKQ